jgi:hypothetical protein
MQFPFQILDFDKQLRRRINVQQGLALFELVQPSLLRGELGLIALGLGRPLFATATAPRSRISS